MACVPPRPKSWPTIPAVAGTPVRSHGFGTGSGRPPGVQPARPEPPPPPAALFAQALGFGPRDYFEVEDQARQPVAVRF